MLLYRKVVCNLKTVGKCFTTFVEKYDKCYNVLPFTPKEKILVNNAIINLTSSHNISNFNQNLLIPLFFIKNSDFRNSLISYWDKSNDFKSFFRQNLALLNSNKLDEDLHLNFLKFIETFIKDNFPNIFITFNNLKHFSDFSKISNLCHNYSNCLNNSGPGSNNATIGRKVYLHVGPPNSGKTHDAIKAVLSSSSGIYCAPLRLLAWEMFNTINNSGVKCSLLTGQELLDSGESHVSCTVEMIPFERRFEVAVLDEMQMIGDLTRGYSWTKAFLSLNVPELHICGSKSCVSITANLANIRGDKLEVFEHDRLGNLKVMDKAVGLDELEPGDCVVCFSRYDAFNLRNIIESINYSWNNLPKQKPLTSIVYGLLPPETRYEQIERFNKGLTKVIVASDVIGMGVNVSIRRVIFYRLTKFDGNVSRPLTVSEVHQIAGRAGRFGITAEGFVSCVREQDLPILKELMTQEVNQIEKAVISPPLDTIGAFYTALKQFTGEPHSLLNTTQLIGSIGRVGQGFVMCDFAQINSVSKCLEGINLPFDILKEYLMVPMGSTLVSLLVRAFAASHSLLNSVKISNIIQSDFLSHNSISSNNLNDNMDDNLNNNLRKNSEIKRLELLYEVLDIYTWLSNKFPVVYIDKNAVKELKGSVAKTLSKLVCEPNEVTHEDENDVNIVKNILRPEFSN